MSTQGNSSDQKDPRNNKNNPAFNLDRRLGACLGRTPRVPAGSGRTGIVVLVLLVFSDLGLWTAYYTEPSDSVAFYGFPRSLQANQSILSQNTTLVLSSDRDLFEYLKGMSPDGAVPF